jgi:hypothetical protein
MCFLCIAVFCCHVDAVDAKQDYSVRCQGLELFPSIHGFSSVKFKCVNNVKSVMGLFDSDPEGRTAEEIDRDLEQALMDREVAEGAEKERLDEEIMMLRSEKEKTEQKNSSGFF